MRRLLMLLLAGVLCGGCYVDDRSDSDSEPALAESEESNNPSELGEEDVSAEQAEWDNIRWHTSQGPSGRGAQLVMTLDGEITSDGRFVRFAWDRIPWSGNGLGHFFVWDGSRWVGGKFEWIRSGGQSVKELNNIRRGYNGLRAPARGTPVAFAWTSADGKRRSNLVKDTWK